MKKIVLVFSILFVILTVSGCGQTAKNSEEEKIIKLGTIGPLSGDAAAYGVQALRVFEHRLPEINKKAAEKNIKFQLVSEDGKCAGNEAVTAYQKLKDIDGVKFVLGGVCSSETLGFGPLTKNDKVLALSISSNPDLEGLSPYTYTFSYSDEVVGKTLAEQMKKYKKVAVISEQNEFNIGIRDVWQKALAENNDVEIVANEVFPKGGGDFRVILEKVKKNQPEAILLNPNVGITAQNLLKQMAEIKDWNNYQVFGQLAYTDKEALAAAPEISEGMIVVDSPQIISEELQQIQKTIEEEKGTVADLGTYYTAASLDIIDTVTDLILEFGDNPEQVKNALTSKTFDGYIGKIYFGNSNFPGIEGGIYVVKNGELEYQD